MLHVTFGFLIRNILITTFFTIFPAPMWNENSQVYQLDFGGRVTQESGKIANKLI